MNGIIHPCCHPEDRNAPPNEDDMIRAIFNYIDHIFSICRPRKVLYMAIDGVAPRAKMNQQRARRFNSARDRSQTAEAMEKLKEEWRQAGLEVPEDLPEAWDSNVITPGTPFMARLSQCLHFYIALRLHHNPAWRSLKVVFSDAKCPGEGEHKIMAFIRLQRAQPGYDVNTVHCLYGMDADLIMLGLASHDPYFLIVREKIDFEAKKCQICGQNGHFAFECRGEAKTMLGAFDDQARTEKRKVAEFQFLHVNILREYLARDLYVEHVPHGYDFENAVDDFVFLCFFVGNDFLPHLPSLAIHEGAIDTLMAVWRNLLPTLGGYLTQNGAVNMRAVAPVLRAIGALEDQVFRNRSRLERNQRERERKRDVQERERERVKDGGDGDVVAAPAKPKFAHGDFALNFKKQQFGSSQPAQVCGCYIIYEYVFCHGYC
jgi:5'-3' exoribonuclease 2